RLAVELRVGGIGCWLAELRRPTVGPQDAGDVVRRIALPVPTERGAFESTRNRIGQMPAARVLEDIEHGVEGLATADVARGDGGFHADEAAGVVRGLAEQVGVVGKEGMPIAELLCGGGASVIVG